MQEIWKPIKGYEELYEVSNLGRVKSFHRRGNKIGEHILVQCTYKTGYKYVHLSKNRVVKTHKIYRLVAEAFIPNPNNYPCVNHKDENKENNCVDNLEWCTSSYNNKYSKGKKIIQCNDKGEIIKIWNSMREVTTALKIYRWTLKKMCEDKENYEWRYADE